MTLIGENLHIISPSIKEAIAQRNEKFILELVKKQVEAGVKTIDLNIGPAKAKLEGSMSWLVKIISENFADVAFSLDTTSANELEEGFSLIKNPANCFLNSATADEQRLINTSEIAQKYNSNLIALTLDNSSGIPKTSEERLELAFKINETTMKYSIENSKIYFDPLVLPICVEQSQANVTLEAIRMFKESFDPEVKTVIGLSNVSNGAPKAQRPLINRVFMVLAMGSGLDAVIIDSFDKESVDIYNKLKSANVLSDTDKLYFELYNMSSSLGVFEDVKYNKDDAAQRAIYKTAQILLDKEIYSHSYLENEQL